MDTMSEDLKYLRGKSVEELLDMSQQRITNE